MARMVDIRAKPDVPRKAVATGALRLKASTLKAIRDGQVAKGDPIAAGEVAGLQAVKSTWQVLPHCHPIPLTSAAVDFDVRADRVVCTVAVEATYKTGVEMEALYGVSVALLTVWDMVKSFEKDASGRYPKARVDGVRVLRKEKGDRPRRVGTLK